MTWAPLCLDDEERAAYLATGVGGCRDCTEAFAIDMRAVGRCNGIPGQLLAGVVRDEEELHMDQDTPGTRIPVTLEAPCERCEKADVCAIRPTLEALSSLPVQLPRLDGRIRLELVGNVGCTAFVKARQKPAGAPPAAATPVAGRKLNLTPEERERRRQQALRMGEARRAARADEAVPA